MGSTDAPDAPEQRKPRTDFAWPPTKEDLADWEVVEFPGGRPAEAGVPVPSAAEHRVDEAGHSAPAHKQRDLEVPSALAVSDVPHAPATTERRELSTAPHSPLPASRAQSGRRVVVAPPSPRWSAGMLALAALLVAAAAAAGFFTGQRYAAGRLPVATTAAIHVESVPSGARVFVDGVERGQTPVDFTVGPGRRRLEVASGAVRRSLEFAATAGSSVSHHFEFSAGLAEPGTEAPSGTAAGTLVIRSEPSGAAVTMGGKALGPTPVTLTGLAPGAHEVELTGQSGTVVQTVQIQAGLTTTLVVPLAGRTSSGWLAVRAPFELTLLEDGRVINTTRSEQTMLTAGRHEIEFVNEEYEFRTRQALVIPAGRRLTFDVPMPQGRANINARPWAEVWLGDRRLGETPLGNVALPVGSHELVFRNPQFGERRQMIVVKVTTPARVVVDLRP